MKNKRSVADGFISLSINIVAFGIIIVIFNMFKMPLDNTAGAFIALGGISILVLTFVIGLSIEVFKTIRRRRKS